MRRGIIQFCLIFAALILGALQTSAQTQTTVTGQVLDPNSVPYSGARLIITLNNPGPGSPTYTPCTNPVGCPIQLPGPITLDDNGNIPGGGVQLYANSSISVNGATGTTTYNFQVNENPGVLLPWGTGPQIFTLSNVTIAGASQVLTGAFTAVPPPALTLFGSATGGGGGPTGPAALKPAIADGIFYVTTEGSNANDGRSWGTAKATINGAEAAMPAAGGTIDVGTGTFTAPATLSKPTLLFCNAVGDPTLLTIAAAANVPVISITSSNTRVTQCLIDGNRGSQTSGAGISIAAAGLSGIELDHNTIRNSFNAGIDIPHGASQVRLHENSIHGNGTADENGAQINYVEPANASDSRQFIYQNALDGSAQENSCILVTATSSATTPPTQISQPVVSGNTCVQGAANYNTAGVNFFADPGTGNDESITQATVVGNTFAATNQGTVPGTVSLGEIINNSNFSGTTLVVSSSGISSAINAGDTGVIFTYAGTLSDATPLSITSVFDSEGNTWTAAAAPIPFVNGTISGILQIWTCTEENALAISTPYSVTLNTSYGGTAGGATFVDLVGGASISQILHNSGTSTAPLTGPLTVSSNTFLMSFASGVEFALNTQPPGFTGAASIGTDGVIGGHAAWIAATPGTYTDQWGTTSSEPWGTFFIAFAAGGTPSSAVGVEVWGNTSGSVVSANDILNESGVSLFDSNGSTVSGNNITGPGSVGDAPGIQLTSASNNIIDANTFAAFNASADGGIAIIVDSGSAENCIGINQFASTVTQAIADSGTATGCPNSPGTSTGGPLVTKLLAANVALPQTTPTTIDSQAVTMPSTGCPCRVQISYSYFWEVVSGSSPNAVDIYVTDGTNNYANSQSGTGVASGVSTPLGNNATQTTATYANSAVVTFTVMGQGHPVNQIDKNGFYFTSTQSYLELKVLTNQ